MNLNNNLKVSCYLTGANRRFSAEWSSFLSIFFSPFFLSFPLSSGCSKIFIEKNYVFSSILTWVINNTKGKRNCGLRKSSNAKDGEFIVSVLFYDFKLKFRQNSSINFTNTTRRIRSSTAFASCRFTCSTLSKSSCRFGSSSRFCTFVSTSRGKFSKTKSNNFL